MGWAGGSEIVSRVAKVLDDQVITYNEGGELANAALDELVDACRDHDADNLYELEGESDLLDGVLRRAGVLEHPDDVKEWIQSWERGHTDADA